MLSYASGSLLWFSWLWVTSFVCMSSIWSPFDVSSGKIVAWLFLVGQILPAKLRFSPDTLYWLLRYVATQRRVLFNFIWALFCWLTVQFGINTLPLGLSAPIHAQFHLLEKKVHHSRFFFPLAPSSRMCSHAEFTTYVLSMHLWFLAIKLSRGLIASSYAGFS